MRRTPQRRLAKIIGMALLAGVLTNCRTTTSSSTFPGTANLITIAEDTPLCNAYFGSVVIDTLTFTPIEGQNPVNYIATTFQAAPELQLNLQQLRDFSTILYEYPVEVGTYNQANFHYLSAGLVAYNPTLTPPLASYTVSLVNHSPVVALNPPLTITPGQANVILLDYDAQATFLADASGNLTGQVNPAVSVTQLTAVTPTGAINPNGFFELDDLWGFVRSISNTNTTSNPTYTGSFQMQLLSPSPAYAPEVPINISATTNLVGFANLAHLLPNSYVEVDAILDSQGNLSAKTIEYQALENASPGLGSNVTPTTAMIGPIISIQTDAAGNPTQLNQWVRDAEPAGTLELNHVFQVDLTANPTYQASIMGPNFANLSFGPRNMTVGQEIIVHGAFTSPPNLTTAPVPLPYTVEPTAVFLKLQSIQGTMSSMLQIGSDDATGAFILTPCCTLLQGTPVYVVTNNQTAYVNVTGLGGITPVNSLVIKGMPYYEPQAATVNGVAIPAGTLVIQAKQVHVLK